MDKNTFSMYDNEIQIPDKTTDTKSKLSFLQYRYKWIRDMDQDTYFKVYMINMFILDNIWK